MTDVCRLTNIGNNSISLDDVTFDYWFNHCTAMHKTASHYEVTDVCRLTNIGNDSISLDDVTFDYWFNGPAEGDQQFSTDLFKPICGESTISKLSL